MSWLAIAEECDSHTVHVIPEGDLVDHDDEGTDCVCGVDVEFVGPAKCGCDAWLITHHSLDGRERFERGSRAA